MQTSQCEIKGTGAVWHPWTSHISGYQRSATLENIFDMKGAYVAHIPVAACSPCTALAVRRLQVYLVWISFFLFFPPSVQAFRRLQLPGGWSADRLQSSKMPRVHRSSQPSQSPSAFKTRLALSLAVKMQLGDSTAVEEEHFPNNKGVCARGRGRQGLLYAKKKKKRRMVEWKYSAGVLRGKSVSTRAGASR